MRAPIEAGSEGLADTRALEPLGRGVLYLFVQWHAHAAVAACLTKYSAGYICAVPFLEVVVLRRWRLLRSLGNFHTATAYAAENARWNKNC